MDILGTIIIPIATPAKQGNGFIWTQKHIETHSRYAGTHKIYGSPITSNPSMKRGAEHTFLPVTEELVATGSCWERKRSFSQKVWPLLSQPLSSVRPYIQGHWTSTNSSK